MDTLNESQWDVVISGTSLSQSLLALALSRSGKNVLHVDRNEYYGGTDAALSLQDAEAWADTVNTHSAAASTSQSLPNETSRPEVLPTIFRNAQITRPKEKPEGKPKLGYSRAYSLALSPQLIYTRSALLPTLVSSKVYRQLEFLAVGSWWLFEPKEKHNEEPSAHVANEHKGRLKKIPRGREDVFADQTINLKSKRALMKFLRLAADTDSQQPVLEEWGDRPFQDFLTTQYGLPIELQSALHALTLSLRSPSHTKTSYALPRITRHLASIGVFGPGFGSVVPKWGGLAEVAQVACRAGAVGGGVYVLGRAVENVGSRDQCPNGESVQNLTISLRDGETVRTKWVVGSRIDLPSSYAGTKHGSDHYITRSISITSSPLSDLFPLAAEGAPPPAVAVVVLPAGSIGAVDSSPVYLMVHSSETGECPSGQCVIYATTVVSDSTAVAILELALQRFYDTFSEAERPQTLWALHYSQCALSRENDIHPGIDVSGGIISFKNSTDDLAFDDSILSDVMEVWAKVDGISDGFMHFEDREIGAYDEDDA